MRLDMVSMFCGGGFLKGLYNPLTADQLVGSPSYADEKHVEHILSRSDAGVTSPSESDPFPYLPQDLELFQTILAYYCIRRRGHDIGIIYAVTNREQSVAEEYLKATGFKNAFLTSKSRGGKVQKGDYAACTTWVGIYHDDVRPILQKAPDLIRWSVKPKAKSRFNLGV